MRIAIDCMGGDFGLDVTVPASVNFANDYGDVDLLLVGVEPLIKSALNLIDGVPFNRVHIVHSDEVVTMSDTIDVALRKKKKSSMYIAVQEVKKCNADACISAGNTGAWMAISRYILKTLDGIDRPAIAAFLPIQNGGVTAMLDLGANVDCSANNLLQFSIMGTALLQAVEYIKDPSIGLLNVGSEVIKGNEIVKEASNLLLSSPLNFYGNIEGNDIFKGIVNVVVCDGFVGNIVLKSVEGIAKMFSGVVREEFQRNWFSLLTSFIANSTLKRLKNRLDNRRYNGASLLGLRGIVFKSHGSADVKSFYFALKRSREAIINNLLARTIDKLSQINQLLRS
ncbi:glycerol-3-phosphate acyltransferase PlsX [Candidatus Kinetoplastibacterium blastocrithidii TCC012E]|uniref:Phosphate acyltransferase n=2 Tax=Candidatus Kinetoplastidibacterium blastocrithidiae TaxID=233181 RepID=M1LWI5_9PROT|nr:glycerol-3-phosphate acyltransferase PlsX [Candidatus Kinetoplastibacterium blastocrithidii (ex Strigomonas culicis)]AGF49892.1 glycerol-3-phosphate acyltransferase PlsX [Candidatus Kinetoplastibacterium blastocrithidii TCC012E]